MVEALLRDHEGGIAAAVRERAVDATAVLAAAGRTKEGRALAAVFAVEGAAGDAAVLRYSECDPIHVPSCMTGDAITVPVALKAAVDGAAFERAVLVGGAVGVRLATAVGGVAALSRGVWPALLAAPAVAAVADGVARRRPEAEIANAVALALAGTSGRAGRPAGMPSGRWVVFGQAVARGLAASRAAAAGAEGDRTLLSPEWLQAQGGGPVLPTALGGAPHETEVGLKAWVAARQALTALSAFVDILKDKTDPAEIEGVEVHLPAECLPVVSRPVDPGVRLSEIANLPLAFGIAAHAPERLFDVARDTPVPHACSAFATRVSVSADPDLTERGGRWPARVAVRVGGRIVERRRDTMAGDHGAPDRPGMLRTKLAMLEAEDLIGAIDIRDADAFVKRLRERKVTAED